MTSHDILDFRRLVLDSYEPDRLREVISGGSFEHFLLGRQRCSMSASHWSLGTFQVDIGRYSYPLLASGSLPHGRIGIGMMPWIRQPVWVNGHELHRHQLQIYTEDTEVLYRASQDATWLVISADRADLQQAAQSVLGQDLLLPAQGLENLSPDAHALGRLEEMIESSILGVEAHPGSAPEWRKRLLGACAEAIASVNPDQCGLVRDRARFRLETIRKADEFLRGKVGDAYSSDALCGHLGMSERSLQLHFHEALGTSPKKWFTNLSLHAARDLLAKGCSRSSVTAVALECGFEHPGRFAQCYRELFGEKPSETLGKTRSWTRIARLSGDLGSGVDLGDLGALQSQSGHQAALVEKHRVGSTVHRGRR